MKLGDMIVVQILKVKDDNLAPAVIWDKGVMLTGSRMVCVRTALDWTTAVLTTQSSLRYRRRPWLGQATTFYSRRPGRCGQLHDTLVGCTYFIRRRV